MKKEKESSNEGSEVPQQDRKRDDLWEPNERKPCVPEGDLPNLEARSVREQEVTLTTVMNKLRIVKDEGRQVRTKMEGVDARQMDARQMEASKTEWFHVTTEITARQNTLAARIGRVEGHLDILTDDQNNALESSQAMWRSTQELKDRITEVNLRIQDLGAGIPSQEFRDLQRGDSELREQVFKALTDFSNELVRREASFVIKSKEQLENSSNRLTICLQNKNTISKTR